MRDMLIDEEISIGEYVLSGGELAAAVVTDAVARLVPGVVGKPESVITESFFFKTLSSKRNFHNLLAQKRGKMFLQFKGAPFRKSCGNRTVANDHIQGFLLECVVSFEFAKTFFRITRQNVFLLRNHEEADIDFGFAGLMMLK